MSSTTPTSPFVSITPDQAAFAATVFLPSVEKEYFTTRRVLRAVPETKEGFRPHPVARTAMELAWHLASSDVWFLDGFLNAKFEMEDDSMPGDLSEVADIVALYEEQFDEKFPLVSKLSPEFWATPLSFFGIFDYPAVLYLQFMLNHAIHHRGQLCVYIREMGGKVPNIYGGSFDEPMLAPPPPPHE
jgi:uncharacterized damage-inducible protein DinB